MKKRKTFRQPDFSRIHHSPIFWAGVLLFIAAATIYVLSNDLSLGVR